MCEARHPAVSLLAAKQGQHDAAYTARLLKDPGSTVVLARSLRKLKSRAGDGV